MDIQGSSGSDRWHNNEKHMHYNTIRFVENKNYNSNHMGIKRNKATGIFVYFLVKYEYWYWKYQKIAVNVLIFSRCSSNRESFIMR